MEAAMICEHCHSLMIVRPPVLEKDDGEKDGAVLYKCLDCGHHRPLIASFWRRLAKNKDPMPDDILSSEMALDVPFVNLLCVSYGDQGQDDEWSLPIQPVASAFSCHD
jgi:hypothetical protein